MQNSFWLFIQSSFYRLKLYSKSQAKIWQLEWTQKFHLIPKLDHLGIIFVDKGFLRSTVNLQPQWVPSYDISKVADTIFRFLLNITGHFTHAWRTSECLQLSLLRTVIAADRCGSELQPLTCSLWQIHSPLVIIVNTPLTVTASSRVTLLL